MFAKYKSHMAYWYCLIFFKSGSNSPGLCFKDPNKKKKKKRKEKSKTLLGCTQAPEQ